MKNKSYELELKAKEIISQSASAIELIETLKALPLKQKGYMFEHVVAELYRGNGYLAEVSGGRGDGGADVLIYYPSNPSRPTKVIQTKNYSKPVTYDGVRTELRKFEEVASDKYACNSFEIISPSGYVKDARTLERFNIALSSTGELESLFGTYGKTGAKPYINLLPHNAKTYRNLVNLLELHQSVSVIQATGTGKRYLAARYIADHEAERILFLSPSNYINEQQRRTAPSCPVTFLTYQGLLALHKSGSIPFEEFDTIIVDEFHRVAATQWIEAFRMLIKTNAKAKVIGFSATPNRPDLGIDVNELFFGGVSAGQMQIYEAIAREILPMPQYIRGLYDISDSCIEVERNIGNSKLPDEDKIGLSRRLREAKLNWERTGGVDQILVRHLPSLDGKYLVFCENKEHMFEVIEDVRKWFRKAYRQKHKSHVTISDYVVYSEMAKKDVEHSLMQFSTEQEGIQLLFSVNMLNEGLHIDGVNRALLLRKTSSLNVYLQQIGRVLSANSEEAPLIFDLVNNIQLSGAGDFGTNCSEAIELERKVRQQHGLKERMSNVTVIDESLGVSELMKTLAAKTNDWDLFINELRVFKDKYGHLDVGSSYKSGGLNLGSLVRSRRVEYARGKLIQDKANELTGLDFIWDIDGYRWEKLIKALLKYKSKYGDLLVPKGYYVGDWHLGSAVDTCRQNRTSNKKKGTISPERIRQLDEIGFIWKPLEYKWDLKFQALNDFKEKYGDFNVPPKYQVGDINLGSWVRSIRSAIKKGKLEERKLIKLASIDFK